MQPLTSTFGLDPAIAATLRGFGAVFDPTVLERSRALFAPGRDLSLPAGGQRHDNVAYGEHERQVLDLCTPGDVGAGRPVVLFVPGGGFVGGDKQFYAQVPAFFARRGWLGVAMNYRLAPGSPWPAGSADVAQALDWLARNSQRYGGDASRLHVVAQSAGATHAAGALLHRDLRATHHAQVRSAVLMSGLYRMTADSPAKTAAQYFGTDAGVYAERSPLNHAHGNTLPIALTVAQFDPPFMAESTLALAQALGTDGPCPPLAWLEGHNHVSPVLGLGAPTDTLGDAIATALLQLAGAA